MGRPHWQESTVGMKKGSAWGTAVACGATDGWLVTSLNVQKTQAEDGGDNSIGASYGTDITRGQIDAPVQADGFLRYDGVEHLALAMACGATGGSPVQQGSTTAYAQSYDYAATKSGLFGTLAALVGSNVLEVPSVKWTGFTITWEYGMATKVQFRGIGSNKVTDSVTNTSATMANVTILEDQHRQLFSQTVFRINTQSGGALASSDKIYPSKVEWVFDQPMEGAPLAGGVNTVDEPGNSGIYTSTVSITFPRSSGGTYHEAWTTAQKMDIVATGAVIEAPYSRSFTVSFPNLEMIANDDFAAGTSIIPETLQYRVLGATAAPTGMTNMTNPFYIDVVNEETSDILA